MNGAHAPKPRIVATYDYVDESGRRLSQAVRYEPKQFKQRRPSELGGWEWNLKGVRSVPYRLPELLEAIGKGQTVFVVEGEKDVDNLGKVGVIATCNAAGAGKWKAEHAAFLKDADVVILPDNDEAGRKHAELVARSLRGVAARVRMIDLPGLAAKGDVSDWLSMGRSGDELWELVQRSQDELAEQPAAEPHKVGDYSETAAGIEWSRFTDRGDVRSTLLTNFTARIASDVVQDDGVETARALEIDTTINGRTQTFVVPANQFASMNWVLEHLGAEAVVQPGQGSKDRARAAIQILSGRVRQRAVFTHTGWREVRGQTVFMHGGGALGPGGPVGGIEVSLPEQLSNFQFPDVGDLDLPEAVNASLAIRRVAPDRITIPLLGCAYRAPLCEADFGAHLSGPTGAQKSELAALIQQHFGPAMDARSLPASWSSTANALDGFRGEGRSSCDRRFRSAGHNSRSTTPQRHRGSSAPRPRQSQWSRTPKVRCHDASVSATPWPHHLNRGGGTSGAIPTCPAGCLGITTW